MAFKLFKRDYTEEFPEESVEEMSGKKIKLKDIERAASILNKYKEGKQSIDAKIISNEEWFRLRHWNEARNTQITDGAVEKATSAWLFNAIASKHADFMDNAPTVSCLPREASDEYDARILSEIMPAIDEQCGFEKVYSDESWYKLKNGTGAYSVLWDAEKDGIGDISIKMLDVLNVFPEPGVSNIQDGKNLFIVSLRDRKEIEEQFPDYKGDGTIRAEEYRHDDYSGNDTRVAVVDWYYKKNVDGRNVLHLCQFSGDTIMYSSEDDPNCENGYYEHGLYPVVFDPLFPISGTPYGFGVIDECKDPQLYIDKLSTNLLEYSTKAAKPRWFKKRGVGINEKDYLDWSKPIVEVEGDITDERLRQIGLNNIDANIISVLQMKIDEMKETTFNREFSNGGTAGGVTAASAIAAIQESGNKASRDMIKGSYRAYTEVQQMKLELIRQFYTIDREFRIVGENGDYRFESFNARGVPMKDDNGNPMMNESGEQIRSGGIAVQNTGTEEEPMYRKPIIDIKVRAMKANPFDQMSHNETVKELYRMGMFLPENAQQASVALESMQFEGIEKLREKIAEGQTLMNTVQALQEQMNALYAQLGMQGVNYMPNESIGAGSAENQPVADAIHGAVDVKSTPYAQKLKERARASV